MYMSIKSIFKCVVSSSGYKKKIREGTLLDDKVSIKLFEKVSYKVWLCKKKDFNLYRDIWLYKVSKNGAVFAKWEILSGSITFCLRLIRVSKKIGRYVFWYNFQGNETTTNKRKKKSRETAFDFHHQTIKNRRSISGLDIFYILISNFKLSFFFLAWPKYPVFKSSFSNTSSSSSSPI